MTGVGEGEGAHRGGKGGVPQGALQETGGHAGCEQWGCGGMPQGRDGHTSFGHAGTLCGGAEGAWDTGATQGRGRGRTVCVIPPRGGQEPGVVPRGLPVSASQSQRICGQGDITVLGALAAVARDLEALAIAVGDLQGEGCMEPEAQTIDRGEGDLVVPGGGGRQEPLDLLHTEAGWETVGGWRAHAPESVPVAREDVLSEAAEATGADTQGRWGEAINVFAVQEGVLPLLCGEQVGRCALALSPQASGTDRGFLSPFACATELEGRNHVLTQWAHEISPFVRRVVRLRRKIP